MNKKFHDDAIRARITFKEVLSRITGFSIPIFGLSWTPPESERKIIYELFIFLEDRRVLYYPEDLEESGQVTKSILDIRKELTSTLQKLSENSKAIPHLKAMRAACRNYLDKLHLYNASSHWRQMGSFFTFLGELRGIFGFQIAQLSAMYGIDLEGDIVEILPLSDE